MAVQRSTINGAVLNGAALTVVFAAAVFAGAGSVSASSFRNTPISATLTGVGAIPYSTLWQVHSAHVNGQTAATVYAYSSVVKQGAASATGSSVFFARQKPVEGGAEVDATGSFLIGDATIKQPGAAVAACASTFSSVAYRWVWDNPVLAPSSRLIGEPGVKLDGDSFWTFEASATKVSFGSIAFEAGGIRIIPYDSVFAGIGTLAAPVRYKHRTGSALTASCVVTQAVGQTHKAAINPATATATMTSTGVRYAKVSATHAATALFPVTAKAYYWPSIAFTATTAQAASPTRRVFHGYPSLDAQALFSVGEPVMRSLATAEVMGWAVVTLEAQVNIRSQDVVTFLRAPEQRDFIRSPENRTFYRSAT